MTAYRTRPPRALPLPPRRSAMADAAALRLADPAPTELPPPFAALEGAPADGCAHAQVAALRWREQHPD